MSPPEAAQPRALIADDDATMRLLARQVLVQAGFDVVEAGDGEAALAAFRAAPPDLVLLDVDMPGLDGYSTCEAMRRLDGSVEVPIVMVTGMDDLASINRAYEAGATDFISKPINWPMLGHRARYVLRSARALRELHAAQARNNAMLSAIPDLMFIIRRDGTYLDYQAGCDSGSFATPERYIGRQLASLLPAHEADAALEQVRRTLDSGALQSAIYETSARGHVRHFEVRTARCAADEVLAVVRDVTSERRNAAEVRRLAYSDSLTGMPNRRAFLERLEHEVERAREHGTKLAVLFLDLDGFKRINDTKGHNVGDALLQAVARRLKERLRASDVVSRPGAARTSFDLARLGGDEFTVILTDLRDPDEVAVVARRIQAIADRPFDIEGEAIVVSASVGIALYPDNGADADTLLKHADTAMYHAKDAGRNNWKMYSAALTSRAVARLETENDLRRALERDELVLHWQPQYDVAARRISGAEALLRWQHPTRGLIGPVEFIAVAEESGLILPIGAWVLERACAQARVWSQGGRADLRVAVNCSARQLRDADFVGVVAAAVRRAGIDGNLLELELTESMLMDAADANIRRMLGLREAGIRFAIDDFGTGYSSMSYLKRFPLATLKLDRSFVSGLPASQDDVGIATAILAMAHGLGLDVVAEGVETPAQARFLIEHGCEKLQGYLIGRPLPAAQFDPLLAEAGGFDIGCAPGDANAGGAVVTALRPAQGTLGH